MSTQPAFDSPEYPAAQQARLALLEKPARLEVPYTLVAEHIRDMGGDFVGIAFPPGVESAMLNREQALALAAFLAHWAGSASPTSDYLDGEELRDQLAKLAPWFPEPAREEVPTL